MTDKAQTFKPRRNFLKMFLDVFTLNNIEKGTKFRGIGMNGYNPYHVPKRTKYKGWMKERKGSTFNKNK